MTCDDDEPAFSLNSCRNRLYSAFDSVWLSSAGTIVQHHSSRCDLWKMCVNPWDHNSDQSFLTCVHEICRISNHGSIDSQALMASSGWAWLLLDAAWEQLNHDITSAGHLFAAGILDKRRNLDDLWCKLGWKWVVVGAREGKVLSRTRKWIRQRSVSDGV